MKNTGQTIGVTATAATANIGDPMGFYALYNDGSSTIWYRDASHGVTLTGDAAAMRLLFAAELKAGESQTVKGIDWNIACATGETATLRILPGSSSSSVNATISGVVVNQDLETIKGVAVQVNGGNVSTGTQTVTLAANDPATVLLGTIDADTAALVAPLKTLGSDTYLEATTKGTVIGGVRTDTRATLGDTDNEFVPIQFTANGDARIRDDDLLTNFGAKADAVQGGDLICADSTAMQYMRRTADNIVAARLAIGLTTAAASSLRPRLVAMLA